MRPGPPATTRGCRRPSPRCLCRTSRAAPERCTVSDGAGNNTHTRMQFIRPAQEAGSSLSRCRDILTDKVPPIQLQMLDLQLRWFSQVSSSRPDTCPRVSAGHMTVVHDPLRTVSVLEPGGPGGCGMNYRALVEETARAAGCLYAQNAGFFNTRSGECLGNVVSDGRVVRDSGGVQNAQFGIRRDGTLVFGYLSQEDVLDQSNPFVQLISGVVWLLRDGQVYINQSMEAECDKTNEMEGFHYFVNVLSARTAVGHDAEGRLVLFHSDGQTKERGMNLWEVAEFLKEHGVINAVNLDGGGSSTFVINGSLASYPPDHDRWRCARPVSTVLCVHPRRCQPADCSGHGECVDGRCRCQAGWRGDACDALLCQHTCGAHGVCTVNGCVCDAGWRGRSCDKLCPLGFYGRSCAEECQCEDQCPCDPITGSCTTNGLILRTGICMHVHTHTHTHTHSHKHTPDSSCRSASPVNQLSCVPVATSAGDL
uniref:N-acetylglucosamine-1-phosphodiester alpha-N-acetylglucosaminidase n=1 Tax=Myripristis murdjan TaxID=586833 RepID=A0A667YPD7_9TELE